LLSTVREFVILASHVVRQLALVEAQRASEMDSRLRAEEAAAVAQRTAAEETALRERAEQLAAAAESARPHRRGLWSGQ
jgi:hypothetical protein